MCKVLIFTIDRIKTNKPFMVDCCLDETNHIILKIKNIDIYEFCESECRPVMLL